MKIAEKYNISKIRRLIDLNRQTKNFSIDFTIQSKNKTDVFDMCIVTQANLDNKDKLAYQKSTDGFISGNVKNSDNEILENYYIIIKSDTAQEVMVEINITPIARAENHPAHHPAHHNNTNHPAHHNNTNHPAHQNNTNHPAHHPAHQNHLAHHENQNYPDNFDGPDNQNYPENQKIKSKEFFTDVQSFSFFSKPYVMMFLLILIISCIFYIYYTKSKSQTTNLKSAFGGTADSADSDSSTPVGIQIPVDNLIGNPTPVGPPGNLAGANLFGKLK